MKYNWEKMTDEERIKFANAEYGQYKLNKPITDKNGNIFGYVSKIISDPDTGLQGYIVIPNDPKAVGFDPKKVKNVTVLYRGSTGVDKLLKQNPVGKDARRDWVQNDLQIGRKVVAPITNGPEQLSNKTLNAFGGNYDQATPQLRAGGQALSDAMGTYKNAQFDIYGHSLGSAVGAYALGYISEKKGKRIRQAFLYEGPNIYSLMNQAEQARADKLKDQIFNYIDSKDPIPLGYDGDQGAVGTVIEVYSKKASGIIDQHMWKGYRYDKNGNVLASAADMLDVQMERLEVLYQTYKEKGRLTASKKLFLDSAEAMSVAKAIETTAIEELDKMIRLCKQAIADTKDLWRTAQSAATAVGMNLSYQEIQDALAQGGVTKATMVDAPTAYYKEKIEHAKALKSEFKELTADIKKGIQKQLATDSELAKEFKAWD